MSNPECNENWHVFDGGLPKAGDICRCGQKRATSVAGELEDIVGEDQ